MLVRFGCVGIVSFSLALIIVTTNGGGVANGMAFGVKRNVHLQESIKSIQDGGIHLNIQLDIGDKKKKTRGRQATTVDSPHLFLNNLELQFLPEILQTPQEINRNYPQLPGMHGQFPHTSSGANLLSVLNEPSFVSMEGTQNVHFQKACWELVWRDTADSGTLVCAFDVPNEAHRNGAALPSGSVYISFTTWNKEELMKQLEKKQEVRELSEKYLKKKNDALERYAKETNLLKKAFLYREVASHVEHYHLSGIHYTHKIPDFGDVMEISEHLFLSTKGIVWVMDDEKNNKSLFPIMAHPDSLKREVGEATIRYKRDETDYSIMSSSQLSP